MLNIEHVCKSYDGINKVLDNININVGKGEIVGIVGLNGAGKSTLLKLISGELKSDGGSIRFNNKNITKLSEKERRKISLLSTENNIYNELSVKDNLEIYRRVYKVDNDVTKKYIDRFKINDYFNKYGFELSTGIKKKVEIVCVTMGDFELLLLDEPTNGIDIEAKAELFDYFLSRLNSNNAIIITSHNMLDIEKLCNRVYVIRNGNIVLESTVNDLKKKVDENNNINNLEDVIIDIIHIDKE